VLGATGVPQKVTQFHQEMILNRMTTVLSPEQGKDVGVS
jgi:hypothetical protein